MRLIPALAALLIAVAAPALAQTDSAAFSYVLQLGREYVNDHALVHDGTLWHLFYTKGDMSIRPWMSPGNEVDIGHATSSNLVDWQRHEPVLRVGAPGSPDAEHVYAPAVVRVGDGWRMYYSANERGFFSGERILAATSSDLWTWTKLPGSPGPIPDSSWAAYYPPGHDSGAGGPVSCRDPFLLRLDDGTWVCYYVARPRSAPGGVDSASIVAATSSDLVTWTERRRVLTRATFGIDSVEIYTHPESPCVVKRNGLYYLFWKGGIGTRYVVSDDPLDFEGRPERRLATSHASKVFEWRGQWFVTSCSRNLNDVMHLESDRTRGLFIAGIRWDGDVPRVTDLPSTLGAESPAAMRVATLRPNPARTGELVRIDGEIASIADELGRLVMAPIERLGATSIIDTRGLAPGSYLIRTAEATQRLVVLP